MRFFVMELSLTWAAFILLCAMTMTAGALFARVFQFPQFEKAGLLRRCGIALLCGFAGLPIVLDLAGRGGPGPMAAAAAVLSIAGLPALLKGAPLERFDWRPCMAAALIWILISGLSLVDWPDGTGGLVHSFLVLDYVKHAAATWSIADFGTPPPNPTYADHGRTVVYYYFYYTLPAVVAILGAPVGIGARHAAYAGGILAGFSAFALVYEVWRRSGADEACSVERPERPVFGWILALLLTTGLDIIPALCLNLFSGGGLFDASIEGWNDEVTSWLNSALWVPHHLAALCAAFVGFIALARPPENTVGRTTLAGFAFASMAGLSVYVALGAAATALAWFFVLARARRWRDAAHLAAAGAGSAVFAFPWLTSLVSLAGSGGPPPAALSIRGPYWLDAIFGFGAPGILARAIALLPFTAIEFGIYGLGTYAFWQKAGRRGLENDLGKILAISALISILISSFLRSTVLHNDLGWRVILYAQLAALVWTLSAIRSGALGRERLTETARACLGLGYAGSLYALAQYRTPSPTAPPQDALSRATLNDETAAWGWLSEKLPKGSVVQSRPMETRAFSYGLYGHFPEAAADYYNGLLFGAAGRDVKARIETISPIFVNSAETTDEVRKISASLGISALVVTALDPVFADPASWAARAHASYSNAHVRIFLLKELSDAPR